jgi:YbbR domain-containing protein
LKNRKYGVWGIKVGAFALAALLWFHAVTENSYKKEIDVRLQVEDPLADAASDEIIVANLLPSHVRVLVSGSGKDLLQLNQDGLMLRVETQQGRAGSRHHYRLTPGFIESRIGDLAVKVEEILEPTEIEVALDRRMEREVEVRPVVELNVAEAYTLVGGFQLEPQKVRISGPAREIRKIRYVETDSLVAEGLQEDVEYLLSLSKPPGLPVDLEPDHITLKADIQILAEDDIAGVPVVVRYARGRKVACVPPTVRVKVRGALQVLANLDPERDLELFVDYRDYSGDSLPVRAAPKGLFEVREIIPAEVNLIVP